MGRPERYTALRESSTERKQARTHCFLVFFRKRAAIPNVRATRKAIPALTAFNPFLMALKRCIGENFSVVYQLKLKTNASFQASASAWFAAKYRIRGKAMIRKPVT